MRNESIYEVSKPYLKFVTDGWMEGRTDRQAESNITKLGA